MTNETKAIPPGIRRHLEMGDARIRELGITDRTIDEAFETIRLSNEAYFHIREVLATSLLLPHRKDGWWARRRLKRELANDHHGPGRHLAKCAKCRAWVDELLTQTVQLIEHPPRT